MEERGARSYTLPRSHPLDEQQHGDDDGGGGDIISLVKTPHFMAPHYSHNGL